MKNSQTLSLYMCIPSNKLLTSNSWREVSKQIESAHKFPLILFISHRWESFENPDPKGKQYRATQKLIEHIISAVRTISLMDSGEHHRYISDLGKHGVLQGALIATRLFATMGELNLNGDNSLKNLLEKEPERLIGIWYDEACLPQGERTKKEALEFQTALQHLPEFVQHSNVSVVALRELQDDYEQRGWCMMEFMLATGQSTYAPLVYRYDLDRESLQINHSIKAGLDFATYLEGWKRADRKRASAYWKSIFLQTNTLPDSILKEEKTPLLSIRTTLAQFVATQTALFIVEKKSYPKDKPIEILKRLQSNTSLLTTVPEDGILVYLMILVGGSSSENSLRGEFEGYLSEALKLKR